MARLPPITSKDQVAAEHRAVFDSIVQSRGAVQGPFTMFLHSPELAGRVAHLGAYVRFEGSLDMRRFGDDGFIQLSGAIGYYSMLAMTVNACELEAAPNAEVLKV